MRLVKFKRSGSESYVYINPDAVAAIKESNDAARIVTMATDDDGPVAFTVEVDQDQAARMLMDG